MKWSKMSGVIGTIISDRTDEKRQEITDIHIVSYNKIVFDLFRYDLTVLSG